MKITVNRYSTDGASLSDERCVQIASVYELCESMGSRMTSYKDIQNNAVENRIFGEAKADSVIRTIFPLLKKIGFVTYPDYGNFKASSFFTDLGKTFVKVTESLTYAKIIGNKEAAAKIQSSLEMLLQIGIDNLSRSEYKDHNILLALDILRQEDEIYWNELLFILTLVQNGNSVKSAIAKAKELRYKDEPLEYVNSKGLPIANTAYSYVRSFLIESGVISNVKGMYSKINPSAKNIIQTLPPYGYQ